MKCEVTLTPPPPPKPEGNVRLDLSLAEARELAEWLWLKATPGVQMALANLLQAHLRKI